MIEFGKSRLRLIRILACACLCLALHGTALAADDQVADNDEAAEITDSTMSFVQNDGKVYVTTIGRIHNKSQQPMHNVVVEVQYFDGDGKLIDATTEEFYSVVVPAGGTVAFRSQEMAATSKDRYASHKARVISEPDAPAPRKGGAAAKAEAASLKQNPVMVWVPLGFFALISLYYIRRASSKSSTHRRSVDLIEKQLDLFDSQNRILERIAKAAEDPERNGEQKI